MRVYRLEHKKYGSGPYNGQRLLPEEVKNRLQAILDNAWASAPPNSDKILSCWNPLYESKLYLERDSKDYFFGVKSLNAIFEWFHRPYTRFLNVVSFFGMISWKDKTETDISILAALLMNGYTIRAYEVEEGDYFVEPNGIQVAFRMSKAKKVVKNA